MPCISNRNDTRDFLRRVQDGFDDSVIQRFLHGKRVLITGAAGFIGSGLARSISQYSIDRLLLLDIAESGLHELAWDLSRNNNIGYDLIVGDICDPALLADVFSRCRPQIVLHAAACKHVSLMEENPFAAARTNVLGTQQIAHAAKTFGAEEVVLVSTDKAVDPAGIMGATKRIAELIVLANNSATRMKAVRLGNVFGSTGSVVPTLQRQITYGGPITITDAACTRFFLSIDQALQRLLTALIIEKPSTVLISDIDDSYRIVDLAQFLLKKAGLNQEQIEWRFTGLRPGEKLFERMVSDRESLATANIYGLREVVSSSDLSPEALTAAIGEIEVALQLRDLDRLLQAIACAVPGYVPSAYLQQQARDRVAGKIGI